MLLLIGASYAVWRYTFTGDANVIDTGEVSLEFLESTDVISIENALPITDEQGKTQTEEFDFAVTTKSGKELDIGYSLYLEKIRTKCSEIESPTQETYPSCYFTISEEDKTELINVISEYIEISFDGAENYYNALMERDDNKMKNILISEGWSEETAEEYISYDIEEGYINYYIDGYQEDTGKTITVNNEFNGENIVYGDSLALKDNEVKIYLTDYEGNVLVGPTRVSNLLEGYLLYSDINEHNAFNRTQTDRYKIKVWVDQDTDASNWDENTKLEYKFKIGVTEYKDISALYSWSTDYVSPGAALDSIRGYTTDYTILGKNYFLKHNIGSNNTVESQELCYMLNSNLYCLKGGSVDYYEENVNTLYASFGEENCSVKSSYVYCSASGLYAKVYLDGRVNVYDDAECYIFSDGDAICHTVRPS